MILFAFPSFEYLARPLLRLPFVEPGLFNIARYKNGELHAAINTAVHGEHCLVLGTIAPPEEQFFSVLLLAHTLKKEGASKITGVFPYLAYSRHDKNKPWESLAAKLAGQLLKTAGIGDIWTIDVHSERDKKLFPIPIISLSSDELFVGVLKSHRLTRAALVAPDNGAIARCQAVKQEAEMPSPIIKFEKRRTEAGIEHTGPIGAVGKRAVIIDDMIDTGETLVSACKKLKAAGVKEIYVFASHALFTGSRWKHLWKHGVKRIFCTNSVPLRKAGANHKIVRLSVGQLLAALARDKASSPGNGEPAGDASVGVDTEEVGLTEEPEAVYPAPESRRFGVRTDRATNPAQQDQGDEQYEGKLWGTPDDLSDEYGEERKERFIQRLP